MLTAIGYANNASLYDRLLVIIIIDRVDVVRFNFFFFFHFFAVQPPNDTGRGGGGTVNRFVSVLRRK